jgi:hypothetical protein
MTAVSNDSTAAKLSRHGLGDDRKATADHIRQLLEQVASVKPDLAKHSGYQITTIDGDTLRCELRGNSALVIFLR